ncbi:diaminobutyrate-2-oxoglutarate aminotransferase [Kangiella sp. HD9-110m-PIT-SAG07]|nr:diaminobutyrate-2-oxoglutarate aminotransferase [Kangiella sp. HD9-110m-PIT-SAG07]
MLIEQPPVQNIVPTKYCVQQLAESFNQTFAEYNIILKHGADEPFYQASELSRQHAIIHSTYDYFSSALHEIAHWCIAGEERRQHNDYGYWYEPDGRSPEQQAEFFKVEVKPQALEWAFSLAAGVPFRVSVDNLDGDVNAQEKAQSDAECFRNNVYKQLKHYFVQGFPPRALSMIQMLSSQYRAHQPIQIPKKESCLL